MVEGGTPFAVGLADRTGFLIEGMRQMKLIEGLNQEQKEAVLHVDGPCLVLAGAGSGKTRVLTTRLAYLCHTGVRPGNILAITFTNKAAREMKERVARLLPGFSGQWIQTFHAACYRILRQEIDRLGYGRDFSIIDEGEQKTLVKESLQDLNEYRVKPEIIAYFIGQAKNSLASEREDLGSHIVPEKLRELYQKAFRLYQARLKTMNCLDFDDLILLTIRLFRENEDVLAKYREKFKYVMIDEYQDTNYAQYVLSHTLAREHRNLFIVGDPDQSIYSWRGAEPENIKRFLRDYPEAKIVKLETNYRSTKVILDAANAVIRHNRERDEKVLKTDNAVGEKISYFQALDGHAEAEFVANTIIELVGQGYRYRDMAIFYRTHAQSRYLEDVLRKRLIPYYIVGARSFYQRKEIKDVLAYLKLACNPHDGVSFRRVINFPRRGIGEATLKKIEEFAISSGIPVLETLADPSHIPGVSRRMATALENFYGLIKFVQALGENGPILDVVEQLLEASGYVEEIYRRDPLGAEERIENLKELKSVALEFDRTRGGDLREFLAEVSLVQDTDTEDVSDAVALMTFHSAKGLEFPVVFMTGMEEGIFPSVKAETHREIEEERRLCYVGITRARERLFLSSAASRVLWGYEMRNLPSRFLGEIPMELFSSQPGTASTQVETGWDNETGLDLMPGDVVQHRKFGQGVVIDVLEDGEIAVVDFFTAGTKMLRTDIAPMVKLETSDGW